MITFQKIYSNATKQLGSRSNVQSRLDLVYRAYRHAVDTVGAQPELESSDFTVRALGRGVNRLRHKTYLGNILKRAKIDYDRFNARQAALQKIQQERERKNKELKARALFNRYDSELKTAYDKSMRTRNAVPLIAYITNNHEALQSPRYYKTAHALLYRTLNSLKRNEFYMYKIIVEDDLPIYRAMNGYNGANLAAFLDWTRDGYTTKINPGFTFSDTYYNRAVRRILDIEVTRHIRPKTVVQAGKWFEYISNVPMDLSKYQIFNKEQLAAKDELEHCLVYSLTRAGVDKKYVQTIKFNIAASGGNHFPKRDLKKIADIIHRPIHLSVLRGDKRIRVMKYYPLSGTNDPVNLGLFENHYFYDDYVTCSEFYAKNWRLCMMAGVNDKTITRLRVNVGKKGGLTVEKEKKVYKTVRFSVILKHLLHVKKNFSKIFLGTPYESKAIKLSKTDAFTRILASQLSENMRKNPVATANAMRGRIISVLSTKGVKVGAERIHRELKIKWLVFADFEADTNGARHKAYSHASKTYEIVGKQRVVDVKSAKKSFYYGYDCAYRFMKELKHGTICYYHNLKYDNQFINARTINMVMKDGAIYERTVMLSGGRMVIFRDSYKLISTPLARFEKMFAMKIKKEAYPYGAYNVDTLNKKSMSILYALKHIPSQEKKKLFVNNLKELKLHNDTTFDHRAYCKYYNEQDVELLSGGFLTFRGWIQEAFNIDALCHMTAPSLANYYLKRNGAFKNCCPLVGLAQNFVQRSVVGGRVMVVENKSCLVVNHKGELVDAVSLYPSAMARLPGFPVGNPKIATSAMLNFDALQAKTYYYAEVEFKNFPLKRKFPLTSTFIEGKRDFNNCPKTIVCGKIGLEDAMTFQGVTKNDIVIKQAIYWEEGFNKKICVLIKKLFEQRLRMKSIKNPVQEVYKLLMNAAYGKTIIKASSGKTMYVDADNFPSYVSKNFNNFVHAYAIDGGKQFMVKLSHSTLDHQNFAHIGSMVLEMSKRIMNEAICLAEDLKIPVFYQDTDSMHVGEGGLAKLALAFQKKYARKLIGKDLGQFHGDFALTYKGKKINPDHLISERSVFLGKKSYMDLLSITDGKGKVIVKNAGCHFRMKGIPKKSLLHAAKNFSKDETLGVVAVYDELTKKSITFDMTAGNTLPRFKADPIGKYKSLIDCERTVSFGSCALKKVSEQKEKTFTDIDKCTSDDIIAQYDRVMRLKKKIPCKPEATSPLLKFGKLGGLTVDEALRAGYHSYVQWLTEAGYLEKNTNGDTTTYKLIKRKLVDTRAEHKKKYGKLRVNTKFGHTRR